MRAIAVEINPDRNNKVFSLQMVFASYGGGWALRVGIGINSNLSGHPMSVSHFPRILCQE